MFVRALLAAAGAVAALSTGAASAAVVAARHRSGHDAVGGAARSDITPTLKPASDRVFYEKDYVRDASPRPKVDPKFGYPYPIVQDSGDYDDDYIKDENRDGGEWRTQEEYDHLRTSIEKWEAAVRVAQAEEAAKKKDVDAAAALESDAEAASEKAERAADAAQEEHRRDVEKLQELVGKEGGRQVGGALGKQVTEVNKEITDVEECQRQLKLAQARLNELMEAREKRRKALEQAQEEAGATKDAAQARLQAAKEAKYEKLDADLVKRLKDDERNFAEVHKEFKMSQAEMRKTEQEFSKVAAQLRQSRQKADAQGGVYPVHSSAAACTHPQICVIVALASLAASSSLARA